MHVTPSGRYSRWRSCNARSPSLRKTTGLVPSGLRRHNSSASQRNSVTFPSSRSARTRLCCGRGRRFPGCLPLQLVDHLVGGADERLDGVHRPHRRHPLLVRLLTLAPAMVRLGRGGRFLGLLLRLGGGQSRADQRHALAVGT